MNPFTYLWMRYKDSGWHYFHKEMYRGWKLGSGWDKFFDVGFFIIGLLIFLSHMDMIGFGYMLLILLVLGQSWVIRCFTKDLRHANNAFLVALHMLHEERRGKKDEDSGS